jgi:hypothetical protein
VLESVVHEVFVDLVRDDDRSCSTATALTRAAPRRLRTVPVGLWGVDQQDLRARGDRGAQLVQVESIVRGAQGDRTRWPPAKAMPAAYES